MKIRFLKGTTLAGGKPVNPGEVHEVSADDAHRFVHIWRDAEIVVDSPKPKPEQRTSEAPPVAAVIVEGGSDSPSQDSDVPKESKKGKK